MSHEKLLKLFPPPRFLDIPTAGVDISDNAVRYVKLKRSGGKFAVSDFGEKEVPTPLIGVDPLESKGFEGFLASFVQERRLRFANISLPESKAYLFRVELPRVDIGSIRPMIEARLEEFVPVPATEAIFDYEVVGGQKNDKPITLGVTVLPSRVVYAYLDLFKRVGFEPLGFEIEGQAIARAVVAKGDSRTFIIVNISESRTTIFVVSGGVVGFSSTVNVGGADLVEVIKKNYQVSATEAEKIKNEQGFHQSRNNRNLFYALVNSFSVLRDEIQRTAEYWRTHAEEIDTAQEDKIDGVLICGEDAGLPGFLDYFRLDLKVPVELCNVWANVCDLNSYLPPIPFSDSLKYAAAVGLALGKME